MPSFTLTGPNGAVVNAEASHEIADEATIYGVIFAHREALGLQLDSASDLAVKQEHRRANAQFAFKGETIHVEFRDYDDHAKLVHVTLNA